MNLVSMSELARGLNVDRRQVNVWSERRSRNGFPEHVKLAHVRDSYGRTRLVRVWDLHEVVRWRQSYVPSKGGNPNWVKV